MAEATRIKGTSSTASKPDLIASSPAVAPHVPPSGRPTPPTANLAALLAVSDAELGKYAPKQSMRGEIQIRKLFWKLINNTYRTMFDPVKPLGISIGPDMAVALGVPIKAVKRGLKIHARRNAYLAAMAAPGSQLHNLSGKSTGPVLDEHRTFAQILLSKRAKL